MKSRNQTGSAHIVIVIILVVVVLGLVGFVFWNNFINKPVTHKTASSTSTSKTVSTDSSATSSSDSSYLTLSDWGVKFKIPTTSEKINYYKQSGATETYGFTTARVEALGDDCVGAPADGSPGYYLGSVTRQTTNDSPYSTLVGHIDGYYYFYQGAQSICSVTDEDAQSADRTMIQQLLSSVIKS